MSTVEEGTLKLDDGFEVYTKTWKVNPYPVDSPLTFKEFKGYAADHQGANQPARPKARVLFVHGFSDHCECNLPLGRALSAPSP